MFLICVYVILDFREISVLKTPKQHKKSAAEGARLLRLLFRLLSSYFLDVQDQNVHILNISNGTCFFRGPSTHPILDVLSAFCEISDFLPNCYYAPSLIFRLLL